MLDNQAGLDASLIQPCFQALLDAFVCLPNLGGFLGVRHCPFSRALQTATGQDYFTAIRCRIYLELIMT
jgi:hypothetical protein